MKLTKKQRIALEFLAEVGPVGTETRKVEDVLNDLCQCGFATYLFIPDEYRITKQGREALTEATK